VAAVAVATGWPPIASAYESKVRPPFVYSLKWSKVPVRVHYVRSVAGICGSHAGLLTVGCSKRSASRCDIYIKSNPAPLTSAQVLLHERAHCKGWHHP